VIRNLLARKATPQQKQPAPPKYKVLPNGICDVGSPRFRQICAVSVSGTAYVAKGRALDDAMIQERLSLIASGAIPEIVATHSVNPADVANYYAAAREEDTSRLTAAPVTDANSSNLLMRALAEAAKAGASDLKIYVRDGQTDLRVKIAGKEFDLGDPWTHAEGYRAIVSLFDARDEGGQHVSMAAGEFQSFSISPNSKLLKLPPTVIKLRGQKGFHENDGGLGDHVVLRFFYNDAQTTTGSLEDLGFDAEVMEALARARSKLAGCVIVGGATGDGKSTTLIRIMDRLYAENHGNLAIVTVEDPVEYRARGRGIVQIPVGSAGDADRRAHNYRQALMHFVRINPDVGSISEIRDADGAKQILQFVASGHATYTTIHAESAGEILFRLIDMGVPPEELAKPGGVKLLMKQTLVPVLCPHCARSPSEVPRASLAPALRELVDAHPHMKLRNEDGCAACDHGDKGSLGRTAWAGYRRLIAVGEVIEPDETWFRHLLKRDAFAAQRHWLTPKDQGGLGGTTLGTKIARLALAGQVDPGDAIRKGADFATVLGMSRPAAA
jgi:type II secretory ATPase GspE/PulE/Tfp pilus assembly ATPase PilB-like protein